MTDPITPSDEAVLQRRRFLRGSALLAAAAGGAVAATATSALPASADPGEAVLLGQSSSSTTTTTVVLDPGSSSAAALTLTNPSGAALLLTPASGLPDDLPVGGLAAGPRGLVVGVDDGDEGVTAEVLTTYDLSTLPLTIPFLAGRVLNTKDSATRESIVATSTDAFDSKGRLRKGAWIDVALLPTEVTPFLAIAAHLTLTALGSSSAGSLVVCPPGPKPPKVATLPFDKGRTVATGTYVELGVVEKTSAVRIYASATTHLKLDVTGLTVLVDFDTISNNGPGLAKVTSSAQKKVAQHVAQVSARARLA
ncbi:hypothetical protein GCM10022197_30560 [Microlunatus spumicola]|uniref:Tat (Twin-arginine translocation) pathway signal sequence n=1 Tax=Microlunatus spumicola TaxID=81499 RepID=A0ABP6XT68_9ACTN